MTPNKKLKNPKSDFSGTNAKKPSFEYLVSLQQQNVKDQRTLKEVEDMKNKFSKDAKYMHYIGLFYYKLALKRGKHRLLEDSQKYFKEAADCLYKVLQLDQKFGLKTMVELRYALSNGDTEQQKQARHLIEYYLEKLPENTDVQSAAAYHDIDQKDFDSARDRLLLIKYLDPEADHIRQIDKKIKKQSAYVNWQSRNLQNNQQTHTIKPAANQQKHLRYGD